MYFFSELFFQLNRLYNFNFALSKKHIASGQLKALLQNATYGIHSIKVDRNSGHQGPRRYKRQMYQVNAEGKSAERLEYFP